MHSYCWIMTESGSNGRAWNRILEIGTQVQVAVGLCTVAWVGSCRCRPQALWRWSPLRILDVGIIRKRARGRLSRASKEGPGAASVENACAITLHYATPVAGASVLGTSSGLEHPLYLVVQVGHTSPSGSPINLVGVCVNSAWDAVWDI